MEKLQVAQKDNYALHLQVKGQHRLQLRNEKLQRNNNELIARDDAHKRQMAASLHHHEKLRDELRTAAIEINVRQGWIDQFLQQDVR